MKLLEGQFFDRVQVAGGGSPLLAVSVQGSNAWLAVRASPNVVHIFQASRLQAVLHFPEDIVSLEWALARPWHVQSRQPHPLLLLNATSALQRSWLLQVVSNQNPSLLPSSTSAGSQHTPGAPPAGSPRGPHARTSSAPAEPQLPQPGMKSISDEGERHSAPWTDPHLWEAQEAEQGVFAQALHVEESCGVRVTARHVPVKVLKQAFQGTAAGPRRPVVVHLTMLDACVSSLSPAGLAPQRLPRAGLLRHAVWEAVAAGASPVLAAVLEHSLRMDGRLAPVASQPDIGGGCTMEVDHPLAHTTDQGPPECHPGTASSCNGVGIRPLLLSVLHHVSSGSPPASPKSAPASKVWEWLSRSDSALDATCSVLLTAPSVESSDACQDAVSPVLLECRSRCSCSAALLQELIGSPASQAAPSSCLIYGTAAGNVWGVPFVTPPAIGLGSSSGSGSQDPSPVLLFQLDHPVLEILPFSGVDGTHGDPGVVRGLVVVSGDGRVVWLSVASEACQVQWAAPKPSVLWGGKIGHVKVGPRF